MIVGAEIRIRCDNPLCCNEWQFTIKEITGLGTGLTYVHEWVFIGGAYHFCSLDCFEHHQSMTTG